MINAPCTTCAGLRIKENKEVYEGEVVELTPEETENQVSPVHTLSRHLTSTTATTSLAGQLLCRLPAEAPLP